MFGTYTTIILEAGTRSTVVLLPIQYQSITQYNHIINTYYAMRLYRFNLLTLNAIYLEIGFVGR